MTYLHFTDDRTCEPDGGLFINFPPMRFEQDQAALWKGIAERDVYAVGTDDFAVMYADRQAIGSTLDSIPVGVAGVELRVAVFIGEKGTGRFLPRTVPATVREGRI